MSINMPRDKGEKAKEIISRGKFGYMGDFV
jgi:hypothetical protein